MNAEKIFFVKGQNSDRIIVDAIRSNMKFTANFINAHDLYQFKNEQSFKEAILSPRSINLIDGFLVSLYLSISNFSIIKRFRGPDFTEKFLRKGQFSDRKMFFIGLEEADLDLLSDRFSNLRRENLFCYKPSFVRGAEFPSQEREMIIQLINEKGADFVWIAIGSPKQNILSHSLASQTDAKLFFNVGAAFDFLLGKKKRSPKFWQRFGLEWLYRFMTDLRNSRKKVFRSFVALKYLTYAGLK